MNDDVSDLVDPKGRLFVPPAVVKFEAGQKMLADELRRRAAARRPQAVRKAKVVPDQPLRDAAGQVVGILRGGRFLPVSAPDAPRLAPGALVVVFNVKGEPVGTAPARALTKVKQATQPTTPVTKAARQADPLEALRRYALSKARPAPPLPPGEAARLFRRLRAVDPGLGR